MKPEQAQTQVGYVIAAISVIMALAIAGAFTKVWLACSDKPMVVKALTGSYGWDVFCQ